MTGLSSQEEAVKWLESLPTNIFEREDIRNRHPGIGSTGDDFEVESGYGCIQHRMFTFKDDHEIINNCSTCGRDPIVIEPRRPLVDTQLVVDIIVQDHGLDAQRVRRWLYGMAKCGAVINHGGKRRGQALWDWEELEPKIEVLTKRR